METKDFEYYSHITQLRFTALGFEWLIENYNNVSSTLNTIKSREFSSSHNKSRKWYLQLYPLEIGLDSTMFKISLGTTDAQDVYVQASMFLSSPSNKRVAFGNIYNNILPAYQHLNFYHPMNKVAEDLDWKRDSEESLTIICELRILLDSPDIKQKVLNESETESQNLIKDIFYSFGDPTFKDITFLVQGEEFKAHKYILTTRSKVFAEILKNKMSKEPILKVEIHDVDPDVFEKILRFMYTDEVDDFKNSALKLFAAAHKFDLKSLKNICMKALCENPDLVRRAIEFYVLNWQQSKIAEAIGFEFV